ncbi:MAG: VOC family protein [Hyphomicrobiaceae bacterium]
MNLPFAVLDIDHVVLRAQDPAALEQFYTEVLGCPLDLRQKHIQLTQLRAGRAQIDIVPAMASDSEAASQAVRDPNMEHFCLRIDPFDATAIRRHLDSHGIAYSEVHDRYGADGRGPSIYLEDPEGNRIELKGPPSR